ncbi:hypothetical protein Bp8pS_220 [Bacillus phage vB_BpuM-BpSp]|nr:hypothetical protein Bp8pS_220 [Bacillus phage vB_BpuM-BpSp]
MTNDSTINNLKETLKEYNDNFNNILKKYENKDEFNKFISNMKTGIEELGILMEDIFITLKNLEFSNSNLNPHLYTTMENGVVFIKMKNIFSFNKNLSDEWFNIMKVDLLDNTVTIKKFSESYRKEIEKILTYNDLNIKKVGVKLLKSTTRRYKIINFLGKFRLLPSVWILNKSEKYDEIYEEIKESKEISKANLEFFRYHENIAVDIGCEVLENLNKKELFNFNKEFVVVERGDNEFI